MQFASSGFLTFVAFFGTKSVVSFLVVARAHILLIFGSQNDVLPQTPQLLKQYPQAATKLFDDGVNRRAQKKKFLKKRMRNAPATGIHAAAASKPCLRKRWQLAGCTTKHIQQNFTVHLHANHVCIIRFFGSKST